MTTKKTLVVKVSHDASEMSDFSLEIAKVALRLQGISQGLKSDQIDFEVIKEETEAEAEPTEAEINDDNTCRQKIINLFKSAFGNDEDDDDGDDDEVVQDEE